MSEQEQADELMANMRDKGFQADSYTIDQCKYVCDLIVHEVVSLTEGFYNDDVVELYQYWERVKKCLNTNG